MLAAENDEYSLDVPSSSSGTASSSAASVAAAEEVVSTQLTLLLLKLESAESSLHEEIARDSARIVSLQRRAADFRGRQRSAKSALEQAREEWMQQRAHMQQVGSSKGGNGESDADWLAEWDSQMHSSSSSSQGDVISTVAVQEIFRAEDELSAVEDRLARAQGEADWARRHLADATAAATNAATAHVASVPSLQQAAGSPSKDPFSSEELLLCQRALPLPLLSPAGEFFSPSGARSQKRGRL